MYMKLGDLYGILQASGLQRAPNTAQNMKFSIKYLFSKFDQICRKLRIWSRLLKKSLMENFIFCRVKIAVIGLHNEQS